MNEYLTPQQVAKILQVHRRTVWNMIHDGRLKAVVISGEIRKSYRILRGELDRFVAKQYESD